MHSFVLITPAHNEAAFLEKTLPSVVSQTVQPRRWVIVNDASTDRTAEVVSAYASEYPFIRLVNVERPPGRHFGNKVTAFNRGLREIVDVDYDYIGNLDADVSLDCNYFENILCEFAKDPKLGIGGGMVASLIGDEFVSQEVALDSVAGAVQLFRRKCFEQIGGYMALPNGGVDAAAEIAARMKGWATRTFPEQRVLEHRRTGSATARPLASRIREGRRMHSLGYSILFFMLRCIYRSMEKPRIIGSGAVFFGYMASMFQGEPLALPRETVNYLRTEQREKLKRILRLPTWL